MRTPVLATYVLLALALSELAAGEVNAHADWVHYGGGQHGMQYSSLSQLNTGNVARLEEAWRFRTGELGQGHREP